VTLDPNTARERALFNALDADGDGRLARSEFLATLAAAGLAEDDQRLADSLAALARGGDTLDLDSFCAAVRPNILLIEKALTAGFIIPDFVSFSAELSALFDQVRENRTGKVADYIPQLGRVEPEQFGVSVCTIDGQQWSRGDADVDFCVQSCCKPVNYALALDEHGVAVVHRHVGREPSGHGFNELRLNNEGLPHNPMINAGAIMCCSLIKPTEPIADRFDFVMDRWRALAGGAKPGFSNPTYLSERATADRNFALGYYMQERKAFPKGTNLVETLEFYFQCCSIESTCRAMSVVAATLANGGVCPHTGEQVLHPQTVQHCLSLMYSCGMYDFSGEFAFAIGLPAKSGVAGAVMVVVPNVLGLCIWSPRLDKLGNSVRGIAFSKGLVEKFNFHNYDTLTGLSEKRDPRRPRDRALVDDLSALIFAASKGDLSSMQQFTARRVRLDVGDYDGRTPLHLAASEGHEAVVRHLLAQHVPPNPVDRWGNTPLDDARRGGHASVIAALSEAMGVAVAPKKPKAPPAPTQS
jgi:glutaminase